MAIREDELEMVRGEAEAIRRALRRVSEATFQVHEIHNGWMLAVDVEVQGQTGCRIDTTETRYRQPIRSVQQFGPHDLSPDLRRRRLERIAGRVAELLYYAALEDADDPR